MSTKLNDIDDFKFSPVTKDSVFKILTLLKSRKNGGVNQVPAFIYKLLEPLAT